jgi:ribosome-binding protein aMBF1 (putative translation factor)
VNGTADRAGYGLMVARRARGWTVDELATRLGWAVQRIRDLELGKARLDPGEDRTLIMTLGLEPSAARAVERLVGAT